MAAVAWPTLAQLKQRLNVDSDDWDTQLARVLASAITVTKSRIGTWDEDFDQPDEAISQSSLELSVEFAQTDESLRVIRGTDQIVDTSKSQRLLYGKRRRFGIG
jgi:hypothetical protein